MNGTYGMGSSGREKSPLQRQYESVLRYTNGLRPRVPRCAPVRLEHWNLSLRYNIDTSKPHSNPVFLSVHN